MKLINLVFTSFAFLVSLQVLAMNENPGCREATEFLLLAKIAQDKEVIKELEIVKTIACTGSYDKWDTIRYSNDLTATNKAGEVNQTWYYSNQLLITYNSGLNGKTWLYPNGVTATTWSGTTNRTWTYPNNTQIITSNSGEKSTYIYNEDGTVCTSSAPEFKTEDGDLDTVAFLKYVLTACMGLEE